MDQESGDWIGAWKICGKTTYLQLQCKQMESLYVDKSILPIQREMMRINWICVLSDSKKGVAYDFVNNLYNLWLKATPRTQWIETAVDQSNHVIAQRQCENPIFNAKDSEKKNLENQSMAIGRKSSVFLPELVSLLHTNQQK